MEWPISATQLVIIAVPLTVATLEVIRRIVQSRIVSKGYPLPPGPTPLPIIGNVLSIDAKQPWLKYTEWRAKYGDIVYIRVLDSDIVILNSYSVAMDLLEKRSHIYSDRPEIATVVPYGHDCNFAFSGYNEHWRLCRRIFHQSFRAKAVHCFRPMQLYRARQMILNIVENPEKYSSHISTFAAASVMSMVYDYEPRLQDDPFVSIIDNYLKTSMPALTSEYAALIRAFPFLLRVPDWFPGSWIKHEANIAYSWRNKMMDVPYEYVQTRMESEENMNDAMVSNHITRMESFDEPYRSDYETAIKRAAATAYLTGVESTSSSLMVFTLAMVEHPHVWKRAQAEIDAVVGTNRLPGFDDRATLPFVEAIIRETRRWKPVAPLGVPHAVTNSDVYRNYYIPKGATVIENTWAMSRDESVYPNPEKFMPERFLDDDGMLIKNDPADYIFGFGRRMCPGKHAAQASNWIIIATMLATLDFNRAKDADGKEVMFTPTFRNGLTFVADPFPCQLTPRPHITKEVLDRVLAE